MDIFDGLSALGGLCLFLFGMSIMAEALQRRAGGRLGGQLRRMTRSRWAGFFTGLAVTAAVQSYQSWQRHLGRDINPTELIAKIREAGAKRVKLTAPADIVVGRTQLPKCTGQTVTYGGLEDD